MKIIIICLFSLLLGGTSAYFFVIHPEYFSFTTERTILFNKSPEQAKKVIGFLPYWLVSKAKKDYSPYITNLTYFALTIDADGKILRLTSPIESEPGWYSLSSGKMNSRLKEAKDKNIDLSLTVFNGDSDMIDELISDPINHADNLVSDVMPIMKKYGFNELNLDIESTKDATDGARENFNLFVQEIKQKLKPLNINLVVDITGRDLISKELIDPAKIGQIADYVMVMTYDFHYAGSSVTGAVAPLSGAGVTAEYDVESAIGIAKKVISAKKIILGVPLYGYGWETVKDVPHSGIIPGTGVTMSSNKIEDLLKSCSTCSASFDPISMESNIIYKDTKTNTYHQLFFPDNSSTKAKLDYANKQGLGGIGIWALGYEGENILDPLREYKGN